MIIFAFISIHALVKRATRLVAFSSDIELISIHALVKRATFLFLRDLLFLCHFNPRPRKEGDKLVGDLDYTIEHFNPRPRKEGDRTAQRRRVSYNISIHALVKRATSAFF